MGGPTIASIIAFQHLVNWGGERSLVSVSVKSRERGAASRLGVERGSHPPLRKRLGGGEEKAARMGPAQLETQVVGRPPGNVNHSLCNRVRIHK